MWKCNYSSLTSVIYTRVNATLYMLPFLVKIILLTLAYMSNAQKCSRNLEIRSTKPNVHFPITQSMHHVNDWIDLAFPFPFVVHIQQFYVHRCQHNSNTSSRISTHQHHDLCLSVFRHVWHRFRCTNSRFKSSASQT